MTEEEYFRKTYPDSCYGDRPLSPHFDFFQDGVEFGERKSEERIAELKEKCQNRCDECWEEHIKLTKAKELLKKWVELYKPKVGNIPPTPIQVETEQFLSEVEK